MQAVKVEKSLVSHKFSVRGSGVATVTGSSSTQSDTPATFCLLCSFSSLFFCLIAEDYAFAPGDALVDPKENSVKLDTISIQANGTVH